LWLLAVVLVVVCLVHKLAAEEEVLVVLELVADYL
jgi:hypothetical protein